MPEPLKCVDAAVQPGVDTALCATISPHVSEGQFRLVDPGCLVMLGTGVCELPFVPSPISLPEPGRAQTPQTLCPCPPLFLLSGNQLSREDFTLCCQAASPPAIFCCLPFPLFLPNINLIIYLSFFSLYGFLNYFIKCFVTLHGGDHSSMSSIPRLSRNTC